MPARGFFIADMNEFPRIEANQIGLDFETTGLKYWHHDFRAFGVAVATEDSAWYFDFRDHPRVADWLRDMLPGKNVRAHNAQFEYQCVRSLNIDPRSISWYCTMVAECLLYEHHLMYDLDSVAGYRGIVSRKEEHLEAIRAALGARSRSDALLRLPEAPRELVAAYGADDARLCYDIAEKQLDEFRKESMFRVLDLEMKLLPVLADMSFHGVRVNLEAAHAAIPQLDEKEASLQKEINDIVGKPFNVNSTPQIREFFKPEPINRFQWRLIDGTLVGPTKGGKGPSLGQDAMRQIKHPLAAKILDLRKTIKLRDTFIRGHVIGSADRNGYVHTQFNQTRNDADAGTVTGRLSSTDPALQQITKRDKANASILRAMFLPDPGQEWLCADYSQVDFRCAAHLINDQNVIDAYAANPALDYHQVVSDMTGIPRNPPYAGAPNTKQINLGLAFGAGAGKVAFMMGMPYELSEYKGRMTYLPGADAKAIFDLYHQKLPGVKMFMKEAERVAKHRGYVKTAIGRRLRFDGGGHHKAAGLLYQSYAADLHKIGLVRVDAAIRGTDARLMVSVHDEIGVSMPPDEQLKAAIVREYTDFNSDTAWVKMRVPITASGKFGENWWIASKD